jgi:Na+-transporting NADH:ubiquinone oxidoreductase subunit NqrB
LTVVKKQHIIPALGLRNFPVRLRRYAEIDARLFQIAALTCLLLLANLWSDFGSGPLALACAATGCLLSQFGFSQAMGKAFDWRSPLITTCSLALLMRAPEPWWFLIAGLLAMASKAFLTWRGKHMFNPANIAIVSLLMVSGTVWISPGQWGQVAWIAGVMIAFAALVLGRAHRLDMALGFACAYALCLFGRAAWLGDPMTIPVHQLQSGSLIVFSAFMITDPRSTPDRRLGRLIFAAAVALMALWLQIRFQLVGAPLYALALLSPLTPIIDTLLKGHRFIWVPAKETNHESLA